MRDGAGDSGLDTVQLVRQSFMAWAATKPVAARAVLLSIAIRGTDMYRGYWGGIKDWCVSVGSLYLIALALVILFFCLIHIHDHGVPSPRTVTRHSVGDMASAAWDSLEGATRY